MIDPMALNHGALQAILSYVQYVKSLVPILFLIYLSQNEIEISVFFHKPFMLP